MVSVLEVVGFAVVVVDEGAAVVEEAAADDSVDDSEVVDAAALEGAVVVVFSVVFSLVFSVVFASDLVVVFTSVKDWSSVVEESAAALLFNSSWPTVDFPSWHSCANQTAPVAASASEHPLPTKHFSISFSR